MAIDKTKENEPVTLTLKQIDGIMSSLYNLQGGQFEIMTYVTSILDKLSESGSPVDTTYKLKNTLIIMQDNLDRMHELADSLGVRSNAKRG